jgi:hypothetical protein
MNHYRPPLITCLGSGTKIRRRHVAAALANTQTFERIPQDVDYPGLALNINRVQAGRLGVSPKNVVDNVITALTANGVISLIDDGIDETSSLEVGAHIGEILCELFADLPSLIRVFALYLYQKQAPQQVIDFIRLMDGLKLAYPSDTARES